MTESTSMTSPIAADAKDSSMAVTAKPKKMDQAKSLLSGGFAGIATVLAGHPFDTLRLDCRQAINTRVWLTALGQTISKDGLRGLYRGMTSPLVGVTPMFALSFWSYDLGQQLIYTATPKRTTTELTMGEFAIAGAFSALITTVVTTPMERVKVVLQTQDQIGNTGRKYKGMLDAGASMFREGGVASLYRGTVATLARVSLFCLYTELMSWVCGLFVAYEYFHRLLRKDSEPLSIGAVLFSGGMAGVAMWSIAIPPDVIKSRIQAAPAGTYRGFFDCAGKIIAQEGAGALFKVLDLLFCVHSLLTRWVSWPCCVA
ncbi:mitochondrial carnitine carrier [Batrachochytrium salamandrivorans]|nr:mitochondrial carnitine carrier [Batrachochytrium salamandrivorans]